MNSRWSSKVSSAARQAASRTSLVSDLCAGSAARRRTDSRSRVARAVPDVPSERQRWQPWHASSRRPSDSMLVRRTHTAQMAPRQRLWMQRATGCLPSSKFVILHPIQFASSMSTAQRRAGPRLIETGIHVQSGLPDLLVPSPLGIDRNHIRAPSPPPLLDISVVARATPNGASGLAGTMTAASVRIANFEQRWSLRCAAGWLA